MSKFEELCQAYATYRKADRESRQACLEFIEIKDFHGTMEATEN